MHGELWGEERENALKNEKIVLGEKGVEITFLTPYTVLLIFYAAA